MNAGILLMTHTGIASSMLDIAQTIWQQLPDNIDIIEVPFDSDSEIITRNVKQKITELDTGDGVLILSDLPGATPCNLASSLNLQTVKIVSGLNLPMLIRTSYYNSSCDLDALAQVAIEGGQRAITLVDQATCQIDKETST